MSDTRAPVAPSLPPWPEVDFASFGAVEIKPLSRIQKLTAGFLTRNWLAIPHVTHNDEADVTALEKLREELKGRAGQPKITPLACQIKAVVAALRAFPQFNASLDASGTQVVYKKYFHIGVAIDTPGGLLVAVIRDCDRKSVGEIAGEVAALSEKARSKGLSMAEMSGGCFTISSLGGIGGTSFTPIINAPEVAILGVCRSQWKPARAADGSLEWRLMMPLSLSYDHRLINGADAARFVRHLAESLAQPAALVD
jgi:pyruvate dehydrogenase E2 component (dihydrolipoamide acetyltransferase)